MNAFIGECFQHFKTVAGIDCVKLYSVSLLPLEFDLHLVGIKLFRLVVIVQLFVPTVHDVLRFLGGFAVKRKAVFLVLSIGGEKFAELLNGRTSLVRIFDTISISSAYRQKVFDHHVVLFVWG